MKLKDYSLLIITLLITFVSLAQEQITGVIVNEQGEKLKGVEVYSKNLGLLAKSDANGFFKVETEEESIVLTFFTYEYNVLEQTITVSENKNVKITLLPFAETTLSEVELTSRKAQAFSLKRLKDVEETAIYAGKKNRGGFNRPIYGEFRYK